MKYLILSVFAMMQFFVFCTDPVEYPVTDTTHYRIALKLDPQKQSIKSKTDLVIVPSGTWPDSIELFLHKELKIKKITGPSLDNYKIFKNKWDPAEQYMTNARKIVLYLNKKPPYPDRINLHFEYYGKFPEWPEWSTNVITPEWVEISNKLPWFPYKRSLGRFTFKTVVQCDPDYTIFSRANNLTKSDIPFFESGLPVNDIIIFAAKDLKTKRIENENFQINLRYQTLADTTAAEILSDMNRIMELYTEWFDGDMPKIVTLVNSNKVKSGTYARQELIALRRLKDDEYLPKRELYLHYLAYKAAYIWWSSAPETTWEDWLNASFAEYSALLIIRELSGEEAYKNRLKNKRKSVKENQPAVWEMSGGGNPPPKDISIMLNLHNKGPLLLHELAERIGRDRYLFFCKEAAQFQIRSTGTLLAMLETLEGKDTRNWFEKELKTR